MGELRHGAGKGLFAQTAQPGQAHHPAPMSPDSHSAGIGSVLNSPVHPQQAARAGAASGLDVALSAAQGGWRASCAGPGQTSQAVGWSLVFVLRAPGELLKGFRLGTDVV